MTMDKKNVMKAMSLCGTGSETCTGCPYYGMNGCDRHMCDDALALLKANEKPTYGKAIVFTKRDNLSKWFDINGYKYAQGANMSWRKKNLCH